MRIILVILFILPITQSSIGQPHRDGAHSRESCNAYRCQRYHQTVKRDDETKEKVVIYSKKRNRSCFYVDGRCKYKFKRYQYYYTGQLHVKKIGTGWSSGWSDGEHKSTTITYDKEGRRISKKSVRR